MQTLNTLAAVAALLLFGGPALSDPGWQEAGDSVEQAAKDTGDAIERSADEAGRAIGEAADGTERAAERAGREVKGFFGKARARLDRALDSAGDAIEEAGDDIDDRLD